LDSDDEIMFAALMEEEAAVASADDKEHLMMLSCLMALYARDGAKPRRGGSAPGHLKSKPRQRLEGYCILYANIQRRIFLIIQRDQFGNSAG
jgi:hypothetical protein